MVTMVRWIGGLVVVCSLVACEGKSPGDPVTDSDGGQTGGSATEGSATEATMVPTTTEDSEGTGTGDASTGGSPPDAMLCEGYCAYQVMCGEGELEYCLLECEAYLGAATYIGPACAAHRIDYLQCYGELTCEDDPIPCSELSDVDKERTDCTLPICEMQCAKFESCGQPQEPYCAPTCSHDIGLYAAQGGPGCGEAYEAYLACYNMLTCEEFFGETGCEAEATAFEQACG